MRHGPPTSLDPAAGPGSARRPTRGGQSRLRALAGVAALAVALTGCTSQGSSPSVDLDAAQRTAEGLAAALSSKDLRPVTFTGATGAEIDNLFQPLVRGMGPVQPRVGVVGVKPGGSSAAATLAWTWTFPGVTKPWSYETTVQLAQDAGQWKPTWTPAVVEPRLDGSNRLSQHRRYPARGELLGEDGDPIVTTRAVVRIGIDKSGVKAEQLASSARRLARLVDIDQAGYAKRVQQAGASAFVEAITFRATDADRPPNRVVAAIPGALAIDGEAMLAPNRTFARALIGTVGEATADIVKGSGGAVVAGDEVGLSGLQKRYDSRLRGTPGVQVQIVPAGTGTTDPRASATASPTSSPSPSPGPSASPSGADPMAKVTVFDVAPVDGQELTTTLNVDLQKLAEKTLAATKPSAALVALRPSTGAVLAAANGPGAGGQAVATTGQIAPGSTFKVASALALLRAGLKPTTSVSCPRTISVSGRRYKNYDDYPVGQLGTISLQTAVAQSCNTAFVGQRGKLAAGDLAGAAASLGLGTDYDVGFPSFFGSVPQAGSSTARAEALFGQGTVQASPLAMAAVAASVQAGHTVLPMLIQGQRATPTAAPLTPAEASQLKQMLRAVVTQGSGRRLADLDGPPVIAKTGTAEYGRRAPYKTHAWMIAAQGDLAVAVFVQDGDSGSGTAGPLLEKFLSAAG